MINGVSGVAWKRLTAISQTKPSPTPGRGSRMVDMGVRSGSVQSGGIMSADARHEGAQARPRLLVVEDDPNIVELLSASLRFAGFDVTAATSGADAVTSARADQPDLLVLDV